MREKRKWSRTQTDAKHLQRTYRFHCQCAEWASVCRPNQNILVAATLIVLIMCIRQQQHASACPIPFTTSFFLLALCRCIVFLAVRRHTQFVSCIICLYYWICRNCLLSADRDIRFSFMSSSLSSSSPSESWVVVIFFSFFFCSLFVAYKCETSRSGRRQMLWCDATKHTSSGFHRLHQIGMLHVRWARTLAHPCLQQNYLFTCNDTCSCNGNNYYCRHSVSPRLRFVWHLLGGN